MNTNKKDDLVRKWLKRKIWKVVTSIAPSTSKKLQETKLRHKYAMELVTIVCKRAKHMPTLERLKFFMESEVLNLAASSECLLAPGARENAFRQLTEGTDSKLIELNLKEKRGSESIMMNLVAKLAPPPQLSSISGTALQMQRELQWFQEVEKLVNTSIKEKKDNAGLTPRQLFTKNHETLVEKAEKWMKDTSNSCMVVTTLVATVVFSAAFTVPGGNNGEGFPIFLHDKAFTLFIISDALALFSSLTSVVMFLSILTARYAEEDFLKKLPLKLLIGLASLFFAITTMMVAFVAALWIVLHDKFKWISILIYRSTFIGIFHPEKLW
ncbi:hypothetical protein Ddye_025545 [Dipteronia dyeriana]|uniref:PGG domain-containing protein n=1 Tax=Dipteronia dyeriana TaxID=168575 RepID=A0AAD9TLJ5_9ROSI|nr:hypothetical protein Ddye_025545 [Dipteronia dyeriana]